jgi:hypothetical protein
MMKGVLQRFNQVRRTLKHNFHFGKIYFWRSTVISSTVIERFFVSRVAFASGSDRANAFLSPPSPQKGVK